jgi:hypothetical protein
MAEPDGELLQEREERSGHLISAVTLGAIALFMLVLGRRS